MSQDITLANGDNVFVVPHRKPISSFLPVMTYGSKPTDGGNLTLNLAERDALLITSPSASKHIKRYLGAEEFIDGIDRFCLWIEANDLESAMSVPDIRHRLEATEAMRSASKKAATRSLASVPYRFAEPRFKATESIIVPSVSSERRDYIPVGYLGTDAVVSNLAFAMYDAAPWVFALLSSRMHVAWTRAVGGALETRIRYSNTIVYNNFPVPALSDPLKDLLSITALRVLDVREYHCEQTLAELYDPDLMPRDLRDAHAEVDKVVDSIYSKHAYETDEQRLSDLFSLYEAMTADEASKGNK